MRIGSLFSGYGGLDIAAEHVFCATTAWHAEIDPNASKILAHNKPNTPNLGDITKINWDTVPPIDILTGGFPCQDVSQAGKRAGLTPTTRTGLWGIYAHAINKLRPEYVVIENVLGLHSATADSNMEYCPWCMGNEPTNMAMRASATVLADLADLGYNARWSTIPASYIGAPHQRLRVFILGIATTNTLR